MSIVDCSSLAIMAALAIQSRAQTAPQSVESIMDEMVKYGIRFDIDNALWREPSRREVQEAIEELREQGYVRYEAGGKYIMARPPIPVKTLVDMLRNDVKAPVVERVGISQEKKRATLVQLARIVHSEIAEVLDAIVEQDLERPA